MARNVGVKPQAAGLSRVLRAEMWPEMWVWAAKQHALGSKNTLGQPELGPEHALALPANSFLTSFWFPLLLAAHLLLLSLWLPLFLDSSFWFPLLFHI